MMLNLFYDFWYAYFTKLMELFEGPFIERPYEKWAQKEEAAPRKTLYPIIAEAQNPEDQVTKTPLFLDMYPIPDSPIKKKRKKSKK